MGLYDIGAIQARQQLAQQMEGRGIRKGIPPDTPGRVQTGIGRQMVAVREKRGYSKEALAREADVGPLALQAWESGPLNIEPLQKILGVLGCHVVITKTSVTVVDGVTPKNWSN